MYVAVNIRFKKKTLGPRSSTRTIKGWISKHWKQSKAIKVRTRK